MSDSAMFVFWVGLASIGLTVVREFVEGIYGGRLELRRGALGGAFVRVWL